jgi:DNA-binding transcriptional regulator/RsmH inhibitor MraZ
MRADLPEAAWEPVRAQVESFPAFHPQASWWKRLLLGFEEHAEPDGSGASCCRRHCASTPGSSATR